MDCCDSPLHNIDMKHLSNKQVTSIKLIDLENLGVLDNG